MINDTSDNNMTQWTDEQKAIITKYQRINFVNACAGSGKTATILGVMEHIKQQRDARTKTQKTNGILGYVGKQEKLLYLCFNKHLKEDVKKKLAMKGLEKQVRVGTFNSITYQYVFFERNGGVPKFDDFLVARGFDLTCMDMSDCCKAILKEMSKWLVNWKEDQEMEFLVEKLLECKDFKITHALCDRLYMLDNQVQPYRYIFVDEVQDLKGLFLEMLVRQVKYVDKMCSQGQEGAVFFVGDPCQKIYGFLDPREGFNFLHKRLKEEGVSYKEFHLTCSFRCPPHVVGEANKILALLGAIPMQSFKNEMKNEYRDEFKGKGSILLCRTNFAILEHIARAILPDGKREKELRFFNLGEKDIGQIFRDFEDMCLFWKKDFDKIDNKEKFSPYEKLMQKQGSLLIVLKTAIEKGDSVFASDLSSFMDIKERLENRGINVGVLLDEIRRLEEEGKKDSPFDCYISTAHKSKGMEFQSVCLAPQGFMRYYGIDLFDFDELKKSLDKVEFKVREVKKKGEGEVGEVAKNYLRVLRDFKAFLKQDFEDNVVVEELRLLYVALTRSQSHLENATNYTNNLEKWLDGIKDVVVSYKDLAQEGERLYEREKIST
ncbi:UvrD-helicase domain-containing protein [Helicobacter felistomachi]|uniref:UvrD-helicase domain-containing protein n=1 Tax=Helicobacter felistomachi TaxID=3040201 RepID=UPI002572DB1F|nr:UvrD-helicase domain-containing protein [Helicobacter sp. NHP21005]